MGVMYSPDSDYAKERRRWETTHTEFGPPGASIGNHKEFPLMVYRAKRKPAGGPPEIEHFIVNDEQEQRNMLSRGYVQGPDKAIEALEQQERGLATAAAERAYTDQRMSPRAQAEAEAVDESTIQHVGSVPETPIRRGPGRPRKDDSL
jgi:hypothetical protein